jgi:uncharacterized protein (DUF924 family)
VTASAWAPDVLDFWFGQPKERWFKKDEAFDAEISERFGALWERERAKAADAFLGSADQALGAIILFDQFPRNMFRGEAKSFASDPLALEIAKAGVDRGLDEGVAKERRVFFYIPFEHSEDLADQDRAVALIAPLGDEEYTRYAHAHRNVIARFGRFPHRNAIMGREPTAEERAAKDVPSF